MSSKNFDLKNYLLYILFTIIGCIFLLWIPIYNIRHYSSSSLKNNTDFKINEKVSAVIKDASTDKQILSQYVIDDTYINVFYELKDGEIKYESHLYDNNRGLEVDVESLLKENNKESFWNKVYNLLEIKYPKFIVDTIKNGNGHIAFDFKDNEVVIYFMGYKYNPEFKEIVSIKVNYNEIKDFINFSCKLDKTYTNESGYNYDSNKKTVALTFDDGPSGEKTKSILKLLEQNKAHATFFMVGNKMLEDKNTVLEVYNSGNEIGSHTYAHGNLTRETSEERFVSLNKTDEIYKSITGDTIELLRPPYGAYKKELLSELNYSVVLWNIDTEDWRYNDVDRIINTVLDNLSDGSIILMHDSYNRTIEAVEKLLPILYSKGYQVVSVSELAKLKNVELEKNNSYRKIK